jgi:lipopolysaccharide export LptBFGC system permease protein LptF
VRIQLYVLGQLAAAVLFAVAGLSVIVVPTIGIQAVNKLGAIDVTTVARYLPLVVAELVPYLLPMAFLLAVVATYGRLAAERELIAIQMAGFHPARLALPGLVVALPLALGTDHLLGQVSPELKYQQRSLLRDADLSRFQAAMTGRNVLTFGKNVLKSEGNRGNVRTGVELELQHGEGPAIKVVAAEARIDLEGTGADGRLVVRLKDAALLTEDVSLIQAEPVYTWPLSELFPSQPKDRSKAKYLTSTEMRGELERPALEPEKRAEFRYEIHRRHALSATYLLFLLLGLPTGIVLRSTTQLGAFTGAMGYAFVYYVLAMRLGKVLADTGAVAPLVAAWATNALFLAVGLVFFVRALWR